MEKRYEINSKEVIIIEQQGQQHMIPFENAQDFLIEKMGIKFNPSTFLKHLRKSNVIEIGKTFHTKIHEQKFINERPKTELFYGRKKEINMINEFIMGPAKIQSIWGPTNIGKSTLVSKIVEKYEDKNIIFWHKINDFSAPIYLLNHIASTLSSLNKDFLKNFLSSNTEKIEKEVLDILKEELRIFPRKFIFVLDDVHKLSKDYLKFIYKLLQILKDLTKVKFIVIGKWMPYLYDETDVD